MISITITPSTSEHVKILADAMANIIASNTTKPQPKLIAISEPLAVEELAATTVELKAAPDVAPLAQAAPAPAAKTRSPAAPKLGKAAAAAAAPAPAPEVTREEVRALLSELHTSGKTDEVKALLAEYGAVKLPDLANEDYAAVLAKAGQL